MTPYEYLELVVRPNYDDMLADISDVRKTHNAIAAIDALAAHIFYWCKDNAQVEVNGLGDDGNFRYDVSKNRAFLQQLHGIAKAAKHFRITRGKNQIPVIETITDLAPRSFGYGEGVYGAGPYGGGEQVSFMADGAKMQVSVVLARSLEFYEAMIERLGAK